MNDAMSMLSSNDVNMVTSDFGLFSLTPDCSETGYPMQTASYDPYEN